MSEPFVKLFSSILDSTVWAEDSDTRIVWMTMMAMADRTGYVGTSVPGLAHRARVSLEATERALAKFLAPDPHSRSSKAEGRRIEAASRGWRLINHAEFREARGEDDRQYDRERQATYRDRKRAEEVSRGDSPRQAVTNVTGRDEKRQEVTPSASSSSGSGEGTGERGKPPAAGDPLTAHGIVLLLRVAVEREHPDVGLYNPGRFHGKALREFLDDIPEDKRTDATRDEIRQRIDRFAALDDHWVKKRGWSVDAFIDRYTSLAVKAKPKAPTTPRNGAPYIPPEDLRGAR